MTKLPPPVVTPLLGTYWMKLDEMKSHFITGWSLQSTKWCLHDVWQHEHSILRFFFCNMTKILQ